MDEFPARRRLLGQSDPPRNRPERARGPATPDVVDEDFDLFGAEDAASALIERLKDVQPAAVLRSDDGEPLLSPGFDPARDRIEGPAGAARPLVVFGAFGTPTSHALGRLLDDVRERFLTTVDVAWRHYPDPDAHPRAAVLALACEASAAIHTFWSLANELPSLYRGRSDRCGAGAARGGPRGGAALTMLGLPAAGRGRRLVDGTYRVSGGSAQHPPPKPRRPDRLAV